MFYAGTSRVTQPYGLKIYKPKKVSTLSPSKKSNDPKKIKNRNKKKQEASTLIEDIFTRNVVYQEILTK